MIDSSKFHFNSPLISGAKNVLSVFVSNPQYAGTLETVKIYEDGQVAQSLPLKKINGDLYVTDPVSFDVAPSEVMWLGTNPKQESFEKTTQLVDPNNRTYVGDSQDGKSVISIEDPAAGDGTLNAEDTSEFLTDVEVTEEILMDFGFSVRKPKSLKETLKTPIKGMTFCHNFYNFLIN
jgi:hypothetical protein